MTSGDIHTVADFADKDVLVRAVEASMAQMAYTTRRKMSAILDRFAANKARSEDFHPSPATVP